MKIMFNKMVNRLVYKLHFCDLVSFCFHENSGKENNRKHFSLIFALGPYFWPGLLFLKILRVLVERALKVGPGNLLANFCAVVYLQNLSRCMAQRLINNKYTVIRNCYY